MTDTVSKPAPIWREALRELSSFARVEWQWVVGFAAIFAIEELLVFKHLNIVGFLKQMEAAQGSYENIVAVVRGFWFSILLSASTYLVTAIFSTYVFTVLFLRHKAQAETPKFSVLNFFFWFCAVLQKYFVLILPLILLVLLFVFRVAKSPTDAVVSLVHMAVLMVKGGGWGSETPPDISLVDFGFLAVFGAWTVFFYYGLYLFYLVTPLAVLREARLFKISWKMTKAHLWRIWWGSVMMLVVMYAVFMVPFMIDASVVGAYGADSGKALAVGALVQGLWTGITGVAMVVYACTVYRVLLQEQALNSISINNK